MKALFFALLVSLLALPAAAQQPAAASGGALANRAALQAQLAQLDANAPAAVLIRQRLEAGDFQTGDRILVQVEGETTLSDTFVVSTGANGPELVLAQLGALPLTGVLRSELQDKIATHLEQYIRSPVVHVRSLMRILAEGEVARPGYYAVEPELPLADVINLAGGFTQRAKTGDMRLERGGTRIMGGAPLQQALGGGQSLDQLNLRPGDRLFVPSRGDSERTVRILSVLLGIPVTVVALTKVF